MSLVLNEVKQTETNKKEWQNYDRFKVDNPTIYFILLLIMTNFPGLRKSIYRNFYNLNTNFGVPSSSRAHFEASKEIQAGAFDDDAAAVVADDDVSFDVRLKGKRNQFI